MFNLEAARFPRQVIRSESLVITPVLDEPDRFVMPESNNRYARFLVPPGRLTAPRKGDLEGCLAAAGLAMAPSPQHRQDVRAECIEEGGLVRAQVVEIKRCA